MTTLLLHPASLVGLAWLAAAGPALPADPMASAVTVRRAAPRIAVLQFDPAAPPSTMPMLDDEERAVTHSEFGIGAEVRVRVHDEVESAAGWVSTVVVEGLTLDLALDVTVWLPAGAPAELAAHEDGHRLISEHFYSGAAPIARRLGERFVGRALVGEGATVEQARHAAMSQVIRELNRGYLGSTHQPAAQVNELFDELTDHGRAALGTQVAMESALAAWRRAGVITQALAGNEARLPGA